MDILVLMDGTNDIVSRVMAEMGSKGGRARAEKLTPAQRSQAARKAGKRRWVGISIEDRKQFASSIRKGKNRVKASEAAPEQRAEAAKKAALARWTKAKAADGSK